jgi:hypothetical protein
MLNATACVLPDLPEECWNIILANLGALQNSPDELYSEQCLSSTALHPLSSSLRDIH